MPPMPLPMTAPTRVESTAPLERSSPAWSSAWCVAAMLSWANRSRWRAFLRSTYWVGSNPFTSPAKRVSKPSASKPVMVSMPDVPFSSASQVDLVSRPRGVTVPTPVT